MFSLKIVLAMVLLPLIASNSASGTHPPAEMMTTTKSAHREVQFDTWCDGCDYACALKEYYCYICRPFCRNRPTKAPTTTTAAPTTMTTTPTKGNGSTNAASSLLVLLAVISVFFLKL